MYNNDVSLSIGVQRYEKIVGIYVLLRGSSERDFYILVIAVSVKYTKKYN
jgi:hypothetical protein